MFQKKIYKLLVVVLLYMIIVASCSKEHSSNSNRNHDKISVATNSKDNESKIMDNKKIFMEELNMDDKEAERLAKKLYRIGIGAIESANIEESDEHVILVCAKDDEDHTYYIALGTDGSLGIIREGSRDGNVIYGPVD